MPSISARWRRKRPHGLKRPQSWCRKRQWTRLEPAAVHAGISRSSSSSESPLAPKTACRIARSVIRCIDFPVANSRSVGQVSISSAAICAISASYSFIRLPWNGGSSSLRWLR